MENLQTDCVCSEILIKQCSGLFRSPNVKTLEKIKLNLNVNKYIGLVKFRFLSY